MPSSPAGKSGVVRCERHGLAVARRLVGIGLGLLIALCPSAPRAQEPTDPANDPQVREVARQLACYCGCSTQSIADCTCGVASKSRTEIQASLQEGASTQDVVDAWVERHGTRILLEPPREGFHLLGWFLPSALLLLTTLFLLLVMRKWQRQGRKVSVPAGTSPSLDPRYLEQLERELKQLEP